MVISAWKPEVNENATLSTVNIAINDNHSLWPFNLLIPILKWFSLIKALMISQKFGKFREKMKFITLILGPSRKVNFVLSSVFLFETQYS